MSGSRFAWTVGDAELSVDVVPTDEVAPADWSHVHAIFDRCYREADHAYLDDDCRHRLGALALARDRGSIVGFNIGAVDRLDLPGLPDQVVHWGGLACVDPDHRRMRIAQMMGFAIGATIGTPMLRDGETPLRATRYATPASYNSDRSFPGFTPVPGVEPSDWHRAVGAVVASAFGVERFEPSTFVCVGRGRPIGVLDFAVEASEEVRALFVPVDRTRGDSLLGMFWPFRVPDGW